MLCPVCNSDKSRVLHTDKRSDSTRRRCMCLNCRHRYTTFEVLEDTALKYRQLREQVSHLAGMVNGG